MNFSNPQILPSRNQKPRFGKRSPSDFPDWKCAVLVSMSAERLTRDRKEGAHYHLEHSDGQRVDYTKHCCVPKVNVEYNL
mmetsp:Transcript_581/g.1118  ORF Transcript_581/g.1118 Transcript_581/m.1118 type:complete len:80 (-) Transcript_581:192-431(-)